MRIKEDYTYLYLVFLPITIWIVNGFVIDVFVGKYFYFFVFDFLSFFIIPILCLVLLYKKYGIKPSQYGFDIETIKRRFFYAHYRSDYITNFIFLVFFSFITMHFGVAYDLYESSVYGAIVSDLDYYWPAIVIFYFSITAALFEEIYYRSLLFYFFNKLGKSQLIKVLYITLSAVIFALAHFEGGLYKLFVTYIYGLITAYIYYKYQDLFVLITAHFIADIIAFNY